MSGSLSTIIRHSVARISGNRAEARARAHMSRVTQDVVPARIVAEPPVAEFGDFTAARAILGGELRIGGFRMPLPDLTPWEVDLEDAGHMAWLHAFAWLDDMVALGTKPARARAQGWILGWIDRYSKGTGPGWAPSVVAGRLIRLLAHLGFVERDLGAEAQEKLHLELARWDAWLRTCQEVPVTVLDRVILASAGIHAGICMADNGNRAAQSLAALARLCADEIGEGGAIASRNPQELLEVFRRLIGVRDLLAASDRVLPDQVSDAITAIAPSLRTMRLGDGSLVRFHGGGGAGGQLDAALAESGVRTRPGDAPAMGYARLAGGRTVVVLDTARPPKNCPTAHASTLAFEMSAGWHPLIVNTGPALSWQADWAQLPRTTAAHNTLSLDKTSSSRLAPTSAQAAQPLQTRPSMVTLTRARDRTGCWMQARHDGYLEDYGLLHERRVFVSQDGRAVHGEDVLLSPDLKAQRRFQSRIKGAAQLGVALSLNFHLHPSVTAQIDRSSNAVELWFEDGETWLFRQSGGLMDIEPSAYIADPLSEPVEARQIVIRNRATHYEADFGWSLVRTAKASRNSVAHGIDAGQDGGQ